MATEAFDNSDYIKQTLQFLFAIKCIVSILIHHSIQHKFKKLQFYVEFHVSPSPVYYIYIFFTHIHNFGNGFAKWHSIFE